MGIKEKYEYGLTGQDEASEATIIFLNGFRMHFNSWDKVYPKLEQRYRVLRFNRHGVGASSKAEVPQEGNQVVDEMRALLLALNLNSPFVLVAHSLGGIFANLYARKFTGEVSGIIFVDAPHPSEIVEQRAYRPPRILRLLNDGMKAVERLKDKYKYSEDECIETTVAQLQQAGDFPEIPVAVLSGTQKMPFVPQEPFNIHQHYQKKLLDLSPKSKHFLCEGSSHFPQITESEIVISAILDTISAIKSGD